MNAEQPIWMRAFLTMGHPQPPYEAFPEQHPDDVVWKHSGVLITVGDVRELQRFILSDGGQRTDPLAEILRQMPEGNPQ